MTDDNKSRSLIGSNSARNHGYTMINAESFKDITVTGLEYPKSSDLAKTTKTPTKSRHGTLQKTQSAVETYIVETVV